MIVTGLSMVAPHRSAACWNAISRCWPRVVPVFPPTGATAVGSLKPSLAPSKLTTITVAAASAGRLAGTRNANAQSVPQRTRTKVRDEIGFIIDGSPLLLGPVFDEPEEIR